MNAPAMANRSESLTVNVKSLLISEIYFSPYKGGISHLLGEIAAALGPERVCCLTAAESKGSAADDLGLDVYRIRSAFSRTLLVQAVGLSAAIARISLAHSPKVLQLATINDGHIGLWLNGLLRWPFVVYAHGNEILESICSEWPKPRQALQRANH